MIERGRSGLSACALLVWAAMSLTACDVFDESRLISPNDGNNGKDGGGADAGGNAGNGAAGNGGSGTEICNNKDDDGDSVTDEKNATRVYCLEQRQHAKEVECLNGMCFLIKCAPGYVDADGNPGTGCETKCGTPDCDDAGADDGGSNDGG